jgi:hypothetical protein
VISDEEITAPEHSQAEIQGEAPTGEQQRIEETVPIWWGGVNSCYSDSRMNSELKAALSRWVKAQTEANPDATIVESGYKIHHLRHVQKSPPFGRRKCSVNGAIRCFAILVKNAA